MIFYSFYFFIFSIPLIPILFSFFFFSSSFFSFFSPSSSSSFLSKHLKNAASCLSFQNHFPQLKILELNSKIIFFIFQFISIKVLFFELSIKTCFFHFQKIFFFNFCKNKFLFLNQSGDGLDGKLLRFHGKTDPDNSVSLLFSFKVFFLVFFTSFTQYLWLIQTFQTIAFSL